MPAPAFVPLALSVEGIENWALTWLPILFMGLIVLLIGMTIRYVPRTKPQEIKPRSPPPWCRAHPATLPRRAQAGAGDHLHRRTRRGGRDPRKGRLGEKDQTLHQLLAEMDGFASADNMVVVATSNLLDKLDPALLRPTRSGTRRDASSTTSSGT